MDGATTLISIARILTTEPNLTEALRRVAREVAHFIGAETAAVYLLDRDGRFLAPVAAYRVPKHTLSVLTSALLPVDEQGFRDSVFNKAAVTSSSDVQNDPHFSFELFHRFPHRSGVIVPVHVDGIVAGAFYLVWWERAQELDPAQIATLEAVGQQVALLLRSGWLLREAERQRAEALAAEERYRSLVDNVPVGIYRNSAGGRIVDVNPALLETLRFPSREALLAINAATLYVDPGDRERVQQLMEAGGRVQDFALEMRTGDGGTVWVRINSRSVRESDTDYYEGILEDITHQRRAEEAERRAESLRAVAKLANAAAHEINNPLAVITGRLELLRRHLASPEQQARFDQALLAAKRIAEIIAHMGQITRLETQPGTEVSPMLDLRRSGTAPDPAS
jgi:PAS domain S-box-containing protein